MTPVVANAIAEMVHEDLELDTNSEEMVIKCQLIRQLYDVVDAICLRFGECHVEQKQDEYAVLRIISNQANEGLDENQMSFSQVVDFVNTNESVKASALSCHFLSSRHNLTQGRSKNGQKPIVKIFRQNDKLQKTERANPSEMKMTSTISQSQSTQGRIAQF